MIDRLSYYGNLRLSSLRSPQYRHLLLLIFWPIFGAVFWTLEYLWPQIVLRLTGHPLYYHPIEVALDASIPFCEWFLIPYLLWFVLLIWIMVYGLLFEIQLFRRFMWFVILSYSATALLYLLFPNMQPLRPTVFPRRNLLTAIVQGIYDFDTNTNVCPSIHVLGTMAAVTAGLHSNRLNTRAWRLFFLLCGVAISLSTVLLKQHSIVDLFAALLLSLLCYPIVFFGICRDGR